MPEKPYDHIQIELKWHERWRNADFYKAEENSAKPKFYVLEMLPYPSGTLHIGHIRNYSIGDALARYKWMRGFNVLHPMGWDAFGLPAENAAIANKVPPRQWTLQNIAAMKQTHRRFAFSYDWDREVSTCEPEYYRWNQWFFLKMLERGLAYRKRALVNWCPRCATVLANEQVVEGCCWRHEDTPVEQRALEQWFLKITHYADELLDDMAQLEGGWPERVLTMQRNWIGRSEGAEIDFHLEGAGTPIRVFTTRVDTIYGATCVILAPEHPLNDTLLDAGLKARAKAMVDSRAGRDPGDIDKEGIFTGHYAINPYSGEKAPIWIANFVLMGYGTGAIMAVPAHDERDFEFCRKYDIPVRPVIRPVDGTLAVEPGMTEAFTEYGIVENTGEWSGLTSAEARRRMSAHAERHGFGKAAITYRLKDWGISRQRYWGTPIPVIHCPACGVVPVPENQLPVILPDRIEITGAGRSPLENVPEFVNVTCPVCGAAARRETDTMDTFIDSSWYFYRYCDAHNSSQPFDPAKIAYWFEIDQYIGGVEHAILHLIYSRFFTKLLRDLGLTALSEPFPHYLAQGMVNKDGSAMSKSRGNVVDPDEMIQHYGADALRLFILFAAPPENEFDWNEDGLDGCYRFIGRVWGLFQQALQLPPAGAPGGPLDAAALARLQKKMHQTMRKVGEDVEKRFRLNTAVSAFHEFVNVLKKEWDALKGAAEGRAFLRQAIETLTLIMAPFTPHLSEEMWSRVGHEGLVLRAPWPVFDAALAQEEKATIIVEINGKIRDKFEAPTDIGEEAIQSGALALPRIRQLLAGQTVRKVVVIKGKMINIVVA